MTIGSMRNGRTAKGLAGTGGARLAASPVDRPQ
jgi:hypothetical protein